jgi:uncharacterized membrane protein YjfL (UPF0719 family)
MLVMIALLIGAGLIVAVLYTAASFDVVGAIQYQIMYAALGMAWLRVSAEAFPLAGVSLRDDVIERGNLPAALACGGALIGVAACYAGANIGDGPGWWVVVFCSLLSTGTFFVAWTALTNLSPVADSVTIDRDTAAGLRLGAFLIACGLILGRGTAGDWVSAESAIVDVARLLPAVIVLVAVGAWVERITRPTPQQPRAPMMWGVLPSIVYIAVAIGMLIAMGPPV